MKKLILKFALALIPIAVYLAVFIAFEPNNYFGVQNNASNNSPIARIRAYEAEPENAIILGDSRMAHFDMQLVEDIMQRGVSNVSYGGAGLEESIEEFYYLYNINPNIDTVIFGLSFYTLNSAYNPVNRMQTVQTQLENPAAFIFNLEYNINALTVMTDRLSYALRGLPYDDIIASGTYTQTDYMQGDTQLSHRKNLIDYAVTLYTNCAVGGTSVLPERQYGENSELLNANEISNFILNEISEEHSKFSINEHALEQLLILAQFAQQNSINLIFVLPPMDDSVKELVCEPLDIDDAMQEALTALNNSGAHVIDHEWQNRPNYDDTYFYDGFHIDVLHGLPQYTNMLFEEVQALDE